MNFNAILFSIAFLCCSFCQQSCVSNASADDSSSKVVTLEWTGIEQAANLSASNDKKILVDIYTDWCKWCKVMDDKTFSNAEVQNYLKANFNLAKLNAEQKEAINFNGKEYSWIRNGKRGLNELANEILDGQMSYPSIAIFDKELNKLEIIRGYHSPEDLLALLTSKGK